MNQNADNSGMFNTLSAAIQSQADDVAIRLAQMPNNLLLRCVQHLGGSKPFFTSEEIDFLTENQIATVKSNPTIPFGSYAESRMIDGFKSPWYNAFNDLVAAHLYTTTPAQSEMLATATQSQLDDVMTQLQNMPNKLLLRCAQLQKVVDSNQPRPAFTSAEIDFLTENQIATVWFNPTVSPGSGAENRMINGFQSPWRNVFDAFANNYLSTTTPSTGTQPS